MDDDEELEESEIVVKSCNLCDDYLKKISELFGNSNGRDIIMLLVDKEMYVNEISIKLDLRVSLVVYHLKKLGELGFLTITNKPISKKTKNHKFYKINIDAFTVIIHKKDEEDDTSILKKIFKKGVKFALIGLGALLAGSVTWFISQPIEEENYGKPFQLDTIPSEDHFVIIALIVIIIGLATERIVFHIKNKKRVQLV